MKTNYHTHTERCNHAIGSDEEYVLSAIEGGFDLLGFSDHTPWCFKDGYVSGIRMGPEEVDDYVNSVRALGQKYADRIEIKVGLECEYYVDHISWLREERERLGLDYLIFGNHYPYSEPNPLYFARSTSKEDLDLYLKCSVEALESGLFDCFAHPDLFMRGYKEVDAHVRDIFRQLSRTARDTGVVMEFNTSMTYNRELWEIVAEEQPQVIIGLDCHQTHLLRIPSLYTHAEQRLCEMGIEPIRILGDRSVG
ncbi:MAG: histidinol-phosphatase [Rikenellaceae bacterium]